MLYLAWYGNMEDLVRFLWRLKQCTLILIIPVPNGLANGYWELSKRLILSCDIFTNILLWITCWSCIECLTHMVCAHVLVTCSNGISARRVWSLCPRTWRRTRLVISWTSRPTVLFTRACLSNSIMGRLRVEIYVLSNIQWHNDVCVYSTCD